MNKKITGLKKVVNIKFDSIDEYMHILIKNYILQILSKVYKSSLYYGTRYLTPNLIIKNDINRKILNSIYYSKINDNNCPVTGQSL